MAEEREELFQVFDADERDRARAGCSLFSFFSSNETSHDNPLEQREELEQAAE